MGRDQHGCAAAARVGDHVHGGLDAQRVDTVERLVEQQHLGFVEGREHDRHPSPHAMAEAGSDAVACGAEVERFEQVAGRVLPPGRQLAQPGGELEVFPGGGAWDEAADVGAVAACRLAQGVSADVVAVRRETSTSPRRE